MYSHTKYRPCKYNYQGLTHPHCSIEGCLEVVADADEESLSARDHGHPGSEVAHHVVCRQVHAMDVGVQREVLGDREGERERKERGKEGEGEGGKERRREKGMEGRREEGK